jgi:hypothetical protein
MDSKNNQEKSKVLISKKSYIQYEKSRKSKRKLFDSCEYFLEKGVLVQKSQVASN